MKIAAAQIVAKVGKIDSNLQQHYRMIEQAAKQGVELIVFPEMSITGYCRAQASGLAFGEDDKRLEKLKSLSQHYQMIIIVGAPIEIMGSLYIGSFVLFPDGSLSCYTKQYLHEGEEKYFAASFDHNPIFPLAEEKLSFAICADITHPLHPKSAKQAGATLYLASIFYSAGGIDEGHQQLTQYAKQHNMAILMANYSGKHWELESGGKSAFWDQNGNLLATLDTSEALLIVEKKNQNWKLVNSQAQSPYKNPSL